MIRRFLRPPHGPGEWLADGVRLIGVLSVIAAFVWWRPTDAGIVALSLLALVVPRFVGVRPSFDILFCVTVLVAAWSNVLHLYETLVGWDLVVHFVCTGVLAAMTYVILARLQIVPAPLGDETRRATPVVLVTALGLALSALWEMLEWVGRTFIAPEIFVTYQDTIGDMAAGGLGGLLAGLVVSRVRLTDDPSRPR
ncbi:MULTISPECIES: hypothetical protein [Microbacterium]|uniref:hypothetical protein n=1 Tax=Microbacterium TaxID=33882 RepID=UPI000D6506C8|nr:MULTISPECIES: hypothetical protein [Microbacterium]